MDSSEDRTAPAVLSALGGLSLDAFPIGITVADPNGRVLQTNAAAKAILGLSPEEHESRSIQSPEWKVIRSDGTPVAVEDLPGIRAIREQARIEEPEMGVYRPDGTIVWINITAAPLGSDRVIITYGDISEVHRAKANLAFTLQSANAGIWSWDIAKDQFDWSPELFHLYGLDPETDQPTLQTWQKVVHPEDLQKVEQETARFLGEGKAFSGEYRIVKPDGTVRWIQGLGSVLSDLEGRPTGLAGICLDITERKQSEEALRRSEARLSTAQKVAHVGSWEWDFTTKKVEWSSEMYRLFGIDPEAYDGKPESVLKVIHPDDRQAFIQSMEKNLAGGGTGPLEYRVVLPNGEIRNLFADGEMIRGQDDLPVKSIGILHDITERRRRESATEESNARFHSLVANVPGFIAYVNAETLHYEFVNDAYMKNFGKPKDEILGRHIKELLGAINFEIALPHIEEVRAGRSASYLNCFSFTGGKRWVQMHFSPVRNGEGRVMSIAVLGYDITDRMQLEEDHRQIQAQLLQAQKMESLGTLAGGVAHDMNNVLGAILGLASANLLVVPPDSPIYRAFQTISKAATRGGEMVKGLLAFARQNQAEERVLDLNQILTEEIQLLERTTLAKVRCEMDLEQGLFPMMGDGSALTHAFMNLCVNAVDAMPESGTLTLRTRNVDREWIEVIVEDTGMGMPKEILERAMEPFFTTKGTGKGTGLGLSLVYSTVKAHLGRIDIQSQVGVGTKVKIRFPACKIASIAAQLDIESPGNNLRRSLKVLLVDDDDLIQSSMEVVLQTLGHSVVTSLSGEEALEKLENGYLPNIVILDMNMPGLGGGGTLPRLRAMLPTVPVLLSSGRTDQLAVDLSKAHPFVALLPKPFSIEEIQKHLEAVE